MIGYDEQHSIDFGLGINAANDEYAALHGGQRINDGGMTSVMSQRAAWDFYVGGLDWPTSKQKHLDEYRAQYGLPPVGVPPHPNPAPGHLVNLVAQGQFFGLETGERFTAIQCSDFNLLNRWQHGEDISPVLAQRRDCGFNLLRVWTAYDIRYPDGSPNIGTFLDIDYARIPEFVALCADYGLYVEFCAYTGINDPAHWNRLHAAARLCSPRPILELVNELDQNTNEPDSDGRVFRLSDHSQPSGVLSAHGSNGSQMQPVLPHWSYATMHFNDASEWQRKVGHNSMEVWNGPTLANENTRAADRFTSTALAFDAAAGAALLCAGSCFHSQHGKTSELWGGDELACAQAWVNGARSVAMACQAGPYVRRDDLLAADPSLLRVYERPVSGEFCIVEIRK